MGAGTQPGLGVGAVVLKALINFFPPTGVAWRLLGIGNTRSEGRVAKMMMTRASIGAMDSSMLDDVISRLLIGGGRQVQLFEAEIRQLCVEAKKVLLSQPNLLELRAPIKICGQFPLSTSAICDIHGQYIDLLKLFETGGFPPHSSYLFLGDYVDRGKYSLETICLLLAYKVKYPDKVFLLRGNHEDAKINRVYGFYDECKRRFNVRLWKTFCDCFNCLPFSALIDEKILCMHGGLSPELQNMYDIRNIPRPTEIPDYGLLCDLLWSDPDPVAKGWGESDRGISVTFGADKLVEFLEKNDLDLICRAHQVVEDGYEFFAHRRLVTIFSAPNYCGEFDNVGALLSIDEKLLCSFQILKASTPVDSDATTKIPKKRNNGCFPFHRKEPNLDASIVILGQQKMWAGSCVWITKACQSVLSMAAG
ncbi:hypothetical protein ZIOFF_034053 [Zingiber officinale]|uniref:Serine/threonine-protein phosphatase n=1 Tax=Zingiber officinale TaxID=94328 RepID=A0A8J5L7A7_ZINOF|nr:hypothetical protein ZIOFF_034053 [Zingiber officinale]